MKRIVLYFLLLGIGLWAPMNVAYAQIQDAPRINADRIEERIPQDLQESAIPTVIDIPLIEGLPEHETLEPSQSAVTFPVKKIVVLNNTVFANEIVHEQVKTAIGEKTSLTDLRRAALNITNMYRDAGYPFSKAYIPQQTLEKDTVIIDIIEGYVGEVEYRGVDVPESSAIRRYAEALKSHRPVKRDQLERYTLLINDLKGIQAKAIMSLVKDVPGAVKLILLIDEHKNEAGFSLNNRGSDSLGPIQSSLYYKRNDLLSLNEETSLIYLMTPGNNELRYVSVSQSFPIGSEGAKLSYSLRRSDSNPGKEAAPFDIESESNALNVKISYPWIRTRHENLTTAAIFDLRNSATESFDSEIIDDHLRYLRGNLAYNRIHNAGISNIQATLSQGLDIMNATPDDNIKSSRALGSSNAGKLQADLSRRQILTQSTSLTVKAIGQWAFEPVLSAELFGLGGSEYGRALDFSTLTGDHGYAVSAELAYEVPHNWNNINRLNIYSFIDAGQVYDETSIIGKNWKTLSTAGGGVNLSVHKLLNAKFEISKPLKIEATNRDYNVKAYGTVGVKVDF